MGGYKKLVIRTLNDATETHISFFLNIGMYKKSLD